MKTLFEKLGPGWIIFLIVTLILSTGIGTVLAQSSDDVIWGAYVRESGRLRIISDPDEARPSEEVISWNQQGPQGPEGPVGPVGPPGSATVYMPGVVSFTEELWDSVNTDIREPVCERASLATVYVPEYSYIELWLEKETEGGLLEEGIRVTIWNNPETAGTSGELEVDLEEELENEIYQDEIVVSPVDPVDTTEGGTFPTIVRGTLLSDSLLQLTFVADDAIVYRLGSEIRESKGMIFEDDSMIEYEEAPNSARLNLCIGNAGGTPGDSIYIVTVTECTADMEPVVAQTILLNRKAVGWLTFDLYCSEGFTASDTCKVTLKAPTGWVYDYKSFTFPSP